MQLVKYPETEQFRNVIKSIQYKTRYKGIDDEGKPQFDYSIPLPTIEYIGTIKTHGTNGGIGFDLETNEIYGQSRERVISLQQDNSGFMAFILKNKFQFSKIFDKIKNDYIEKVKIKKILIYGEWSGANDMRHYKQKIFNIFKIKLIHEDSEYWIEHEYIERLIKSEYNQFGIYSVYQFPTYKFQIDFNNPEYAQNEIANKVKEIEDYCPVWNFFKPEETEINIYGEGLVLTPINTEHYNSSDYVFKAKGQKHSTSKVKKIANVDIEKVNSVNEFVDNVLTESRLNQGIQYLNEMNIEICPKNTGTYLKWIADDVLKEESDILVESGLSWKDVVGKLNIVSKGFYFKYIN